MTVDPQGEALREALSQMYSLTIQVLDFAEQKPETDEQLEKSLKKARELSGEMRDKGNRMMRAAATICASNPAMAKEVYEQVTFAKTAVIDAMSFLTASERSNLSFDMIDRVRQLFGRNSDSDKNVN